MVQIHLVQPRHTYAPETGIGHVYLPTSLLTVAARLLGAGCEVQIHDENLTPFRESFDLVGVNLVGAPYVPVVRSLWERIGGRRRGQLIVGGQVVSGFTGSELAHLFGPTVINGNVDRDLCEALGLPDGALPPVSETSLIAAYELIDEEVMRAYLEREFCLFLSQGCKYSCTFCAAERSRPSSPGRRVVREVYRSMEIVERDLFYLASKAQQFGLDRLQMYLSNLDLFQSPLSLHLFADTLERVRGHFAEIDLVIRGLSTAQSFLDTHTTSPALIRRLADLGVRRVGFGVDGAAPAVWRATRKPQSGCMCTDAIAIAREEYNLTPETLMVFGHTGVDTEESLSLAVDFTKAMWDNYGSLPRPHVAKSVVPGNDGWIARSSQAIVSELLEWPDEFQVLDFTALPSRITHPDPGFRAMATERYLDACHIEGALTQYVLPLLREMHPSDLERVRQFNLARYDL